MLAMDVLKQAATNADVPITHIGRAMGKRDNYVSSTLRQGSTPKADTLAAMLAPCGYALAAVPLDSLPPDALVIDPKRD